MRFLRLSLPSSVATSWSDEDQAVNMIKTADRLIDEINKAT